MKYFKKFFKNIHINQFIKVLTLSDFFIWSGFGLINPILAIFVAEQIRGGNIEVAGFASAIYLGTKSVLQIPIARFLDLKKGEKDDFRILMTGTFVVGVTPFFYLLASFPWHIYIIQAVYGIGNALSFTAWDAIFTRHIDKNKVAYEWSVYYTLTDLGTAVAAGVGGVIAQTLGFRPLFLLVGIITSTGAFFLLALAKRIK